MDGSRGSYVKCNKPDRERQTPYDFTYNKDRQNHKYREQTEKAWGDG